MWLPVELADSDDERGKASTPSRLLSAVARGKLPAEACDDAGAELAARRAGPAHKVEHPRAPDAVCPASYTDGSRARPASVSPEEPAARVKRETVKLVNDDPFWAKDEDGVLRARGSPTEDYAPLEHGTGEVEEVKVAPSDRQKDFARHDEPEPGRVDGIERGEPSPNIGGEVNLLRRNSGNEAERLDDASCRARSPGTEPRLDDRELGDGAAAGRYGRRARSADGEVVAGPPAKRVKPALRSPTVRFSRRLSP